VQENWPPSSRSLHACWCRLWGSLLLAVTIAADNASNPAYIDGWQAGDDGGIGFGPWDLAFSGNGIGLFHDPQFIDNVPLAGNSLGSPAFALTTGDRPFFTDTSEARRTFESPLGVGQTFSADVDGSALDPLALGFTTGNTFDLYGSIGIERFSLFTNNQYHNDHWTATGDADTGVPAGSSFHVEFTLVTANAYDLFLLPLVGGAPLFAQTGAPLAGTMNVGIDTIRVTAYGTGSSPDGTKEIFFNNLMIIGLAGDYNFDGTVDAADYVVWRKSDGTQTGYNLWRANFGQPAGAGTSAAGDSPAHAAVPEPASSAPLIIAVAGWCLRRGRGAYKVPATL
jgi:hypothetical protein